MSAVRLFRLTSVKRADHGPRQSACEITCSVCGETDHVIIRGDKRLPPDVVAKKFQQAGWTVGHGPAGDRCPACAARAPKPKPQLAIVKQEPPMAAPKAEPPREMTRDDRRLIFAKLEETYLDEATGYAPGWSDAKLADDLGVARAWVERIRDENFGPHGEPAEHREILDRIAAVTAAVDALERKITGFQTEAESGRKNLADQLHDLRAAAKRAGLRL